jgi:nucleoid-associated protein YgaU
MVNEQNSYLTYDEIDKLVKDRMAELRLDVNQLKDQYKKELYVLQDQTQKKIEAKVRADVQRELKRIKGGGVTVRSIKSGHDYIKIVRYKVRKGDNLWKIAEKNSRNPYNWVGIYQTNGRKIRNPHLIYPGQEILIPIIIHSDKKRK